jgi:hypothetical protein
MFLEERQRKAQSKKEHRKYVMHVRMLIKKSEYVFKKVFSIVFVRFIREESSDRYGHFKHLCREITQASNKVGIIKWGQE